LAAQSTSDASIGPADIGGFEEGEFEGDSPTEEVAAQIYYVSPSLITKDRTEGSAGLRIPAAEIEQVVSDRVHQWLLDPGSIYKSTSARLADALIQQRLIARAAEIGKRWPELPVARRRIVLTALIERIEVSVDQIDIRFRPSRLSALLDAAATPLQGATDDETEILSVPVRLRRAGREIRMVINGTDPFAAKPDAIDQAAPQGAPVQRDTRRRRRHPLCCTRPAGRYQPVLFHSSRPPQLSRAGYHPSDPRWAAAARFHGGEASRALPSAACLARSADRARFCLSPIRTQKSPTGDAVLEYSPTEILPPVGPMLPCPARLCRRAARPGPHTRGKPRLLDVGMRIPARDRFAPDSPLEEAGFAVPRPR
jgi:hypothetical protein